MTTEFQAKQWAYTPLVEWLDESHGDTGRTWVHCDQLTLHRRGACEFCDKYAVRAQVARIARGVPFSGEPGAPDALFRPDDTIRRWGGNRPVVATTEGEQLERAVQTHEIFSADNIAIKRFRERVPDDSEYATLVWSFPLPDGRTFKAQINGEIRATQCVGDGSQFCCARAGCHNVCNCSPKARG